MFWYCLIDDVYQQLKGPCGVWRQRGPAPVFTDSEVITEALVLDTFFGDHEALGLSFLRQYHRDCFPHLPSEECFNERRTRLGLLIDQIRRLLTRQAGLLPDADCTRLIGSAPTYVNAYARGGSSATLAGAEYFGIATGSNIHNVGNFVNIQSRINGLLQRKPCAQV